MPVLSVIIAIYNVENYFKRCLISLFEQTLDDIEYIFVNDGSSDNSMDILSETIKNYPNRIPYVKIINHTENLGIAAARTIGIKSASGDYIIHCDPDDYIERNMYELLYIKAIKEKSDIVCCNYFTENNKERKRVQKTIYKDTHICLKNLYKKNSNMNSLWDKLIRRELIINNSIYPFENCNIGEDLGCVVRILYFSKSISYIEQPLYHYCSRNTSITNNTCTFKSFQEYYLLLKKIDLFFKKNHFKITKTLSYFKFYSKLYYRFTFNNLKTWFDIFPESHKYIFLYSNINFKTRLIYFILLKKFNLYKEVKKYNKFL